VDPLNDAKIIDSWHKNATPWTAAVRESRIESRKAITNQAIIDAVLARKPTTALDIGCGEGWLARTLTAHGIRVLGVDVIPELVTAAQRAGGGDFRVASYEMIASGEFSTAPVDVAIANFSFLGKESVDGVVRRIPRLLTPAGALIVQTPHPGINSRDVPYVDGWRNGSWVGFSDDFSDPAPWYFRTLESWIGLFVSNGLAIVEMREPLHPTLQQPASVLFVAVAG